MLAGVRGDGLADGRSEGDVARASGPAAGSEASPDIEPEPAGAAAVFGDRIADARAYVTLLAGPGVERGLIGPRETGRLWSRHVLNSAAMVELIPHGARVVDIGSGAGLPGIPLALARPDIQVDLVESLLRRTTFLHEAVRELGLGDRCRVIRARAEDATREVGGADVVTARAVAPLARLVEWAAPLLRPDGLLLALKGETAADELRRDRAAARRSGIADLEVALAGASIPGGPVTVIVGRRTSGGPSAEAVASRSRGPRAGARRGGRG